MAEISASELSKRFRINKTKVSRAIKNGEISTRANPNGKGYLIEISEAQRWADSVMKPPRKPEIGQSATPSETSYETMVRMAELEAQVKALKEMNELLREEKDRWYKQSQMLLNDRRTKRSLFSRLFGSNGTQVGNAA